MKKEKETIKFKINSRLDRDGLVAILANNGYKVWVEEKEDPEWRWNRIYYVNVELN
ncbi:MAG: hypothetical protein J7K72_01100 [Candidatus Aenigmarchaeota archaeon]|nr:hypothetical protein [Candidatus Aenigmarchaeota archaeon]